MRPSQASLISKLILLASAFNLAIAPTVYASSNGTLSRPNAYAISLLLLLVTGLAIYLMRVIIQPEKF